MKTILLLAVALVSMHIAYAQPWAQMVKDECPNQCEGKPKDFTECNGTVYYSAYDGINGYEIWATDGTAANTRMIKDINPTGDSNPGAFFTYKGKVLFRASKTNSADYTLWITDGTAAGTTEIGGGIGMQSSEFMLYNQDVYFISPDLSLPIMKNLWKTDGTAGGTQEVSYIFSVPNPTTTVSIKAYTVFHNELYIAVDSSSAFWICDGVSQKVRVVSFPSHNWVEHMVVFKNNIYYTGHTYGLFSYDGIASTTQEVSKLGNAGPASLLDTTNTNLLIANRYLWKNDGTISGTDTLIPEALYPYSPVMVGTKMYYFRLSGYVQTKYYMYLKCADINTRVVTVLDTTRNTDYNGFISFQNKLYYDAMPISIAADGSKTFGKSSMHVYDIAKNKVSKISDASIIGSSYQSAHIGPTLLFAANDSIKGMELWKLTDYPSDIARQEVANEVNIYPNPAHDKLNLQLPYNSKINYRVMNLYGQTLLRGSAAQKTEIDISPLPAGVYLVNINTTDGALITKRFVKE